MLKQKVKIIELLIPRIKMSKVFLIISILFINGCCTIKKKPIPESIVISSYKPNFQKVPDSSDYKIVDFFFAKWSELSNQISTDEFSKLDTLEKEAYVCYEELFLDTTFIGFNIRKTLPKYVLLPNTIYIGVADSVYKEYDFVYFKNGKGQIINNFRPRISIEKIQSLYYTEEYKEQLPIIADKFGVGGYINISGFVMSGYPTFLETSPLIKSIIFIGKTKNKAVVHYKDRNEIYETLIKKENGMWIKITDLSVLSVD
jgi:hypothetical protein